MSTNSPLEKIKMRVEEILSETFIEYLLNRVIEYHTRSGLRPGCDCSYCLEKRRATIYIGTTTIKEVARLCRKAYLSKNPDNETETFWRFWQSAVHFDEDEVKKAVEACRESKRQEVRPKLEIEKEKIL